MLYTAKQPRYHGLPLLFDLIVVIINIDSSEIMAQGPRDPGDENARRAMTAIITGYIIFSLSLVIN